MKKGFTLIEILVAVAIMAILTGIIITSLDGARQRGRDTKRISDINQIRLSLASYLDRCRQYPLILDVGADDGCPEGINLGTFLMPIPRDPVRNTPYRYVPIGSNNRCSSYHLGAILESDIAALDEDHDADPVAPSSLCYDQVEDYRDFSGSSEDCGQDSSSPDMCYDVKP